MHFSFFLVAWNVAATAALSSSSTTTSTSSSVGRPPLFRQNPILRRTTPGKNGGVIELPDFAQLFDCIQRISPLAASVIQGKQQHDAKKRGFAAVNDSSPPALPWKIVERHNNSPQQRVVSEVAKIDHYHGEHAPLLRFRASMKGPCVGAYFAEFMTVKQERQKWDTSLDQVYEAYSAADLDAVNIAIRQALLSSSSSSSSSSSLRSLGSLTTHNAEEEQVLLLPGDCSKFGIGYCLTKASFGISSREQLTMCGVQDYTEDGSCIIWGAECEPWHDDLLPGDKRQTRAKSHIFATTLVPTGVDSFDVEYSLQLDIGGRLPLWLTTPVVTETVKSLFRCAAQYYRGKDGHLQAFLEKRQKEHEQLATLQQSLLMTP